jgi:hypothetical protein
VAVSRAGTLVVVRIADDTGFKIRDWIRSARPHSGCLAIRIAQLPLDLSTTGRRFLLTTTSAENLQLSRGTKSLKTLVLNKPVINAVRKTEGFQTVLN